VPSIIFIGLCLLGYKNEFVNRNCIITSKCNHDNRNFDLFLIVNAILVYSCVVSFHGFIYSQIFIYSSIGGHAEAGNVMIALIIIRSSHGSSRLSGVHHKSRSIRYELKNEQNRV
jgi:hypothetical protein